MKQFLLISFLLFAVCLPSSAGTDERNIELGDDRILETGEELIYKVYYGFIKLGEVKFKITGVATENKKEIYSATSSIKSFESIPMVNINYIFESVMQFRNNEVFSLKFTSTEFKEKTITNIYYTFDYEDGLLRSKRETDGIIIDEKNIKMEYTKMFQDGLSLFYNARLQSYYSRNAKDKLRYIVPVFINEKESSVKYSFNPKSEAVSTDLVDYEMSGIKVAGAADFVGVFGLTGEFLGWFSDDDARVPLKAKFNVTIGSITLELSSYKKKNWKPPVHK